MEFGPLTYWRWQVPKIRGPDNMVPKSEGPSYKDTRVGLANLKNNPHGNVHEFANMARDTAKEATRLTGLRDAEK